MFLQPNNNSEQIAMSAPNYYAALGVRQDAPMEDICRAYQQYAPSCHPDSMVYDPTLLPIKNLSQQEYWHLINEACEVLTNAEWRARYNVGTLKHYFPVYEFSGDCLGIYEKFFIHPHSIALMQPDGTHNNSEVPGIVPFLPVPSLTFVLELEIEEMFHGTVKTISYPRIVNVDGSSRTILQSMCFTITPYMRPGGMFSLKGLGHQIGETCGDVEVVLRQKPHKFYTLSGDDLMYNVTVPLSTALFGGKLNIKTIDWRRLTTYISPPFPTGRPLVRRFEGEGMKTATSRGNLFVKISPALPRVPSHLFQEAERILKEVEQNNK